MISLSTVILMLSILNKTTKTFHLRNCLARWIKSAFTLETMKDNQELVTRGKSTYILIRRNACWLTILNSFIEFSTGLPISVEWTSFLTLSEWVIPHIWKSMKEEMCLWLLLKVVRLRWLSISCRCSSIIHIISMLKKVKNAKTNKETQHFIMLTKIWTEKFISCLLLNK